MTIAQAVAAATVCLFSLVPENKPRYNCFRFCVPALTCSVIPIVMAAEIQPAAPMHTNRLAQEKSPYLLQHAHNPVDWYPWGEEAFEKARRENKPIFLSIGYSTCHWCHVMAHESFENEEIAAIMNRDFVSIKVDREERPDVDRVYMTFVQATTGGGGWPMSVWLTPDLKPFVGGTYFPPEDRFGQPAFRKVLERIAAAWKQDHEKMAESGSKIVEALRESQSSAADASTKMESDAFENAYRQLDGSYDPSEGGFSVTPKFPRPVALNFLTRFYARDPNSETGKHALEMDLFTLRKMAAGGIHDHIGGGFHRYSVDRYWHVPHFEKMLYDQAQLANAYLDAFQITSASRTDSSRGEQQRQYADVARDILDYVARDLTSKDGGFFSAEDADSADSVAAVYDRRSESSTSAEAGAHSAPPQKKEGAFYVWTEKQVDVALGSDSDVFKYHFGVQSHGNASEGNDPQDEFLGKNILIERHTISETAQHFKKSDDEVGKSLARSRGKLLEVRSKRPRPHLDDKIIAAWNGLMISAYARAAQVLDDPRYLETANRAAKSLRANLYDEKNKLLFRSFREGRGNVEGFADDYAFVIQGLLDLYEASFDIEWLKFALELQETQDRLFFDEKAGGYFSTSGKDKSMVLRMKDDNDSAEPAASSVAALNLLRLAQLRNDKKLEDRGRKTINAFAATINHFASAMPQLLVALDFSLSKPRQIVIAGKADDEQTKALLKEVNRHFIPSKVLILADGSDGQKFLSEQNEAIGAMSPIDEKSAAFVCENFTCKAPVTDIKALNALLTHE